LVRSIGRLRKDRFGWISVAPLTGQLDRRPGIRLVLHFTNTVTYPRGATRGGMTGSSSTKGMHHAKAKPIRNPTYQAGASRIDGAVPGVYVAVL